MCACWARGLPVHVRAACVNARTTLCDSKTCSGSRERCSLARTMSPATGEICRSKSSTRGVQVLDIANESKADSSPMGSVCCFAGKETLSKKLDNPRSQQFYEMAGRSACTWRAREYNVALGSVGSDKSNILWTEHITLVVIGL